MRIIIVVIVLLAFVNCQENTGDRITGSLKKNDSVNKPVFSDTLKNSVGLFNVFQTTDYKSNTLIISNDTMFLFRQTSPQSLDYTVQEFYYDSKERNFHFKDHLKPDHFPDIRKVLSPSNNYPIYLKTIAEPKLKYASLPDSVKRKEFMKKVLNKATKVQSFNGKYYLIDKTFPRTMVVYDPLGDTTTSLDLKHNFFAVTDFFLYDMDKDSNPEIFIFHVGEVPREEIISYSVYSIRQDSVGMKITQH